LNVKTTKIALGIFPIFSLKKVASKLREGTLKNAS
jgi:hypothetical protein